MRRLLTGVVICLVGLAPTRSTDGAGPQSGGHARGHAPSGKKPAGKKPANRNQAGGKKVGGKNGKPLKKKAMVERLTTAAANKNVSPAQRGALFAGLSGFVYRDNNNNGVFEPASEPGIGGVAVALTGINDLGNAVRWTRAR